MDDRDASTVVTGGVLTADAAGVTTIDSTVVRIFPQVQPSH